jgi:hypothetical protein
VQNPLSGTEHFGAQEPKRIHVIVEYMSSPYPRSAVSVVLDCYHMPGRGQALPVERLSFLPPRLVCEREGVAYVHDSGGPQSVTDGGRYRDPMCGDKQQKNTRPIGPGLRRAHHLGSCRDTLYCSCKQCELLPHPRVDLRVLGKTLDGLLLSGRSCYGKTAAAATHRLGPSCPVAKAKSARMGSSPPTCHGRRKLPWGRR